MDMRCDSVDIANILGVCGTAVTRVDRQIESDQKEYNRKRNKGYSTFFNDIHRVNRSSRYRFDKMTCENDLRETSRRISGSGKVNDNQDHHISV